MRVLFVTYAEDSHYHSLVPLAWALRTAGHEVRVATQPALVDSVVQSGLTAVSVGDDHRFMEVIAAKEHDPEWGQRVAHAMVTGGAEMDSDGLVRMFDEATNDVAKVLNDPMIDDLVAYARQWRPDLVLWEMYTLAGPVAAQVIGAAHARVLWGADTQTRLYQRFQSLQAELPESQRRDPMREWLTATLERFGASFEDHVLTGQWTVDQVPPSLRLPLGLPTIPVRYVPYNGPAQVPSWLREPPTRPRVCIMPSTTLRYMLGYDPIPAAALEAFAGLDIEVVASLAPEAGEQATLPDNVRVVDFVPLEAIVSTCSAVVHMGGAGVQASAMLHGVPQLTLVSPDLFDVQLRADMVEQRGAGLSIGLYDLTPEALRDNVLRLLREPTFAAQASTVRQEILADPTPNEAVASLEKIVASQ